MARRIVVVGGGAAGIGAAGAAKGTDPGAEIIVITEYEDAAYSPCGIPYVHGKEIPSFESLFMATKQQYVDQGIDIRYQTQVASINTAAKTVTRRPARSSATTRWSSPRASTYADPEVRALTCRDSITSRTSARPWSGTRSSTRSRRRSWTSHPAGR